MQSWNSAFIDGRSSNDEGSLPSYKIRFSATAVEHLRLLTVQQRSTILREVEMRLSHEPDLETRNRELMRGDDLAVWELRIGNLRVYDDVQNEPDSVVTIRAVGIKDREIVRIAGKEFKL
jgi:mRNA-degrading endonuclease RelE of RelBE toxin-antitoxin system